MRIAVCEDTAMEAEFLLEMLERYKATQRHLDIETRLFGSAEDLAAVLEQDQRFDLYLLDIIMPGMDGLSLAQALRRQKDKCAIIFLTSSPQFAVEAFAVRAMDYLVKPVQKGRLFAALDDAIALLGRQVEPLTTIQSPEYQLTVKRGDIAVVEVTGHTLCYRLVNGKTVDSKVLRIPFEQATGDLQADPRFISPHRSYLINMDHVRQFTKEGVQMEGGALVPVSRLRYTEIKRLYAEYLETQQSL